ncbi:adenylate/guanylate cyclase domain-containing protein [Magnetospirillum sp. SS-4]|uniref:adenylate/guanylate cyclase domain-containing protein n=1 Tax=Magnetospirillum sp. SS-4 TaxID=2681465 RepID=UPI00157233D7|nr:adenylate/guanylate cyclase domain-containing protein [Magnetospirillum sp. SS-4]
MGGTTLDGLGPSLRFRLHLGVVATTVFLAIYAKSVCPFIATVPFQRVALVLLALSLLHVVLREALLRAFPRPWKRESVARHGFHLSVIGWLIMGGAAVVTHAVIYPDFPAASHAKLLAGYWALGAGILAQVEFVAMETHFRSFHTETAAATVEHISRRLTEGFLVVSVVPTLVMVLMGIRMVYEGYAHPGVAVEVGFLGACFIAAALYMSWRYGRALKQDCQAIVAGLGNVRNGRFTEVRVDASRPDELGLVAGGINEMAAGLALRERIRDAFGRFVDPTVAAHVIDQFSHDGGAGIHLEGRRIEVTVLMADLRGFTPLAESMEPEQLIALLNGYFAEMVAAVHSHGGMVDKFIGDAVMAVFGLGGEPGHTLAAVRCAQDMQVRLGRFNRDRPEACRLTNGIGLHVGEVVAGLLGSPDRLEFTVIGNAVNLAARLEAQARAPRPPILMSAAAAARLDGLVPLAPQGSIRLKGVSEEVEAFSPLMPAQ